MAYQDWEGMVGIAKWQIMGTGGAGTHSGSQTH